MAMALASSAVGPVNTSWPVMMAQFVPPPSEEAMAKLEKKWFSRKPIPTAGTWLTSKNMATVTLSTNLPSPSRQCGSTVYSSPSIALILQGNVHEEHLLSSLAFTWPSFPDADGESSCPGRVVFASYIRTDTNTQLVAESTSLQNSQCNVQHINSISTTSQTHQAVVSKSFCLNQSDTTVIEPNATEESPHQIIRTSSTSGQTEIVSLSHITPNMASQSQIWSEGMPNLKRAIKPSLADLPPRFPTPELEKCVLSKNSNHSGRKSVRKGSNTLTADLCNEQVLKEKMMACLLDPEFQGFVDHVEKVWKAMEDDLAAEISSVNP